MKKRNTTLNISQENFEKYPPAIFLKCTCNVSKLIAMGGGGGKQYYLVREADPSVVFYLHFGTCQVVSNYSLSRFLTMGGREGGGAERTFGPSPPPPTPTQLYCAKYGPRKECSFIVLRRSYNLH